MRGCTVEGCDRLADTSAVCEMHRLRLLRHGTYNPLCTMPQCTEPRFRRGLCAVHWKVHKEEQTAIEKELHRQYQAAYYLKNRERILARHEAYRRGRGQPVGRYGTDPRNPGTPATRRPSVLEIAWAAGIYEGEGTIGRRKKGTELLSVAQKDPELLHRLAEMFGGRVSPDRGSKVSHWAITGPRARGFILTIWPFLTERRRIQAKVALGLLEKPAVAR